MNQYVKWSNSLPFILLYASTMVKFVVRKSRRLQDSFPIQNSSFIDTPKNNSRAAVGDYPWQIS